MSNEQRPLREGPEMVLATPGNALAIIRKQIHENEDYRKEWIRKLSDSFVGILEQGPILASQARNASYRAAEYFVDNFLLGQWHDPNHVDDGYFWVRFRHSVDRARLIPAKIQGSSVMILGTEEQYNTGEFDRFVRMQPPETVVKGLEGETQFGGPGNPFGQIEPKPFEPEDWQPVEALYAFVGDLTSYPVEVRAGASVTVYQIHDILRDFLKRHRIAEELREGWEKSIVPREEGVIRQPERLGIEHITKQNDFIRELENIVKELAEHSSNGRNTPFTVYLNKQNELFARAQKLFPQ